MIRSSVIKTAGPAAGSAVMTGLSEEGPMASVSARGRAAGRSVVFGEDVGIMAARFDDSLLVLGESVCGEKMA